MRPEYKLKAENFTEAIDMRVKILDEMIRGQRKAEQQDALRYISEIKSQMGKLKEIISIG